MPEQCVILTAKCLMFTSNSLSCNSITCPFHFLSLHSCSSCLPITFLGLSFIDCISWSVWSNWLLSTFDFSINFNQFSFICWISNCFPFLLNWNRYLTFEGTCTITLHMLICCFNAVVFSFFVLIFAKLFSIVSILFQIPISSKSYWMFTFIFFFFSSCSFLSRSLSFM